MGRVLTTSAILPKLRKLRIQIFSCPSWAWWLNHSDYNRAVSGTLTIIYVPSFITPYVGRGMERVGKCWCKRQQLGADKLCLNGFLILKQSRNLIEWLILTCCNSQRSPHKDDYLPSVADWGNLHGPLFFLNTRSWPVQDIWKQIVSPVCQLGACWDKGKILAAELASQETLNLARPILTCSFPCGMDIPPSLKTLQQKDLYCLLSAYLQF